VPVHERSSDLGCRRLAALVGWEVGALERPTSGHEDAPGLNFAIFIQPL
jgi:hypothetical protein